ncbi:MAG: recombination protein RecA, partial [Microgenomates group bacterium Gr01-1014_93]
MEQQEQTVFETSKERQKAAEAAIDQIREKFGEGSIMKLGQAERMQVDAVSTGCLSLDIAL